jgi:hypothetical protein
MAILDTMNENRDLRVVKRSDDGDFIELQDLAGEIFTLRISDHLKALLNQARLSAVVDSSDNNLDPLTDSISIKEIQARLRSGEDMESISSGGNVSLEKIERYSTPILQERSYIISLAKKAIVKKDGYSLLEIVESKLAPRGVDMKVTSWNSYRNEDGSWYLSIEYPTQSGSALASWEFDPIKRNLVSTDEGARWILGEEPIKAGALLQSKDSDFGPMQRNEKAYQESTPPRLVAVKNESSGLTPKVEELDFEARSNTFEADFDDELEPDISESAKKDGVTKRISIPSWDDIMFGTTEKGAVEPRND